MLTQLLTHDLDAELFANSVADSVSRVADLDADLVADGHHEKQNRSDCEQQAEGLFTSPIDFRGRRSDRDYFAAGLTAAFFAFLDLCPACTFFLAGAAAAVFVVDAVVLLVVSAAMAGKARSDAMIARADSCATFIVTLLVCVLSDCVSTTLTY